MHTLMENGEKRILIVGLLHDPHVKAVSKYLEELGTNVLVFDPYKEHFFISFFVPNKEKGGEMKGKEVEGEIITPTLSWSLSSISAVWIRWKATPTYTWEKNENKLLDDFVFDEWRQVIRGLEAVIPPENFLHTPTTVGTAQNKPKQLILASRLGFTIPNTLITNNAKQISNFSPGNTLVYKPFTSLFLPSRGLLFANKIEREGIEEREAAIHRAPGIFQELISRDHDLRVMVVGEEVFTVKIESQKEPKEEVRLDWRRDIRKDDMYQLVETPESLRSSLLLFQHELGISFGAYDILVRGSNYIFLECNPEGQWMWLEDATKAPIAKAVATLLFKK